MPSDSSPEKVEARDGDDLMSLGGEARLQAMLKLMAGRAEHDADFKVCTCI